MQASAASMSVKVLALALLAYFGLPVAGGLFSGLLISLQRWKSAAWCLTVSIVIAYGTAVSAMRAAAPVKHGAAFVTTGTLLPCLATLLVISSMSAIRRAIGAARWFGGALTSDMSSGVHRLYELPKSKNTSGGGAILKYTLRLPWRWARRIMLVAVILLVGQNAQGILDFLHRIAPTMARVTNTMDLVSLVFLTPKLFSEEAGGWLRHLFIQTSKHILRNHAVTWSEKRLILAGAFVWIIMYPILYGSYKTSSIMGPSLLGATDATSSVFHSKKLYVAPLNWLKNETSGWLSIFGKIDPFITAAAWTWTVLVMCVVLTAAIASTERRRQEKSENVLLIAGVTIFAYARMLSML